MVKIVNNIIFYSRLEDMMTPEQIDQALDRFLLTVEKPGRYVGGEYNSVTKDWDGVSLRVALAFPDLYDLGMSNLD